MVDTPRIVLFYPPIFLVLYFIVFFLQTIADKKFAKIVDVTKKKESKYDICFSSGAFFFELVGSHIAVQMNACAMGGR